MADYPKSLGKSGPDYPQAVLSKAPEAETYYPSVHLEDCDLPETGTITFRYKVSREVEDKKASTSCTDLDLLEIVSVKGDKKQAEEYGGDALDKIKAALEAATD